MNDESKNPPAENPVAGLDPLIPAPAPPKIMAPLYAVEQADYIFLKKPTGLTRGHPPPPRGELAETGNL